MSFLTELKNIIKVDFTGSPLSDDSDLIKIISKEVSNTFKDKFEVTTKSSSPIEILENKSNIALASNSSLNKDELNTTIETKQKTVIDSNQLKELLVEIEQRVKKQFRSELDKGKTKRIIFKICEWTFTIIIGGIVGAIIQKYLE